MLGLTLVYIYIYIYIILYNIIYIYIYIYTSVNPSISMLGEKGTGRSETEGSETEVVFLHCFFEQLCEESGREHDQVNRMQRS